MKTLLEQLEDRIDKSSGCWIWIPTPSDRYGRFKVDGKRRRVTRLMWELVRGPIPPGLLVLHDCPGGDNKRCVNPDHLFLGTNRDNHEDAIRKGQKDLFPDGFKRNCGKNAKNKMRPGEANISAKLSEDDVRRIRSLTEQRVPQKDIARMFQVSRDLIWRITTHRLWAHV